MRLSDSDIINAYNSCGSVWTAAKMLGTYGQKVHRRLRKIGHPLNKRPDVDIQMIKEHYSKNKKKGELNLKEFSKKIGRSHTRVCGIAGELGLTNYRREVTEENIKKMTSQRKLWLENNEHPRGMAGKKHSQDTLSLLSAASRENYKKLSKKQKSERIIKQMKTRDRNGTLLTPRVGTTWKSQWLELGGKRFFTRSSWEYNYAHILEKRKNLKIILDWEYEADKFWFEKIRSGVRCYIPDFKVTALDGSIEYHEIKGWMDARSKTKLKRMAKYHPSIKVVLIQAAEYKAIIKRGI